MLDLDPWTPPTGDTMRLEPAGHAWDAIRVPTRIGLPLLDRLGHDTGAVIRDVSGGGLFWLVRPRAADRWELPQPFVTIYGATTYIAVPPVDRTEGHTLRWVVPLTPTCYLTDHQLLHDALKAEIDAVTGPRPEPVPCAPCVNARVFGGNHDCESTTTTGRTGYREMTPIPAVPCPCTHASTEADS